MKCFLVSDFSTSWRPLVCLLPFLHSWGSRYLRGFDLEKQVECPLPSWLLRSFLHSFISLSYNKFPTSPSPLTLISFELRLMLMGLSAKAMAPHSSTRAWKIPWMEKPGRLQSMGSLRVGHSERLHFHFSLSCIGEGMAPHSSVLACRTPGMGEPGGLQSMGSQRVGHD